MTRLTTISTAAGLFGLVLAMLAALNPDSSAAVLGLGFGLMMLGLFGAVIGAAAILGRAWQSTR